MPRLHLTPVLLFLLLLLPSIVPLRGETPATMLIEAESFTDHGGWINDTQFTPLPEVGSPYLMAHGLGKPVADANTKINIPHAATWRVMVRTKDWVAPWKAPGAPGRFQLAFNGRFLPIEFGTQGADWHWQEGGQIELPAGEVKLSLHDLTGFNGRCDAILLTTDPTLVPPLRDPELRAFRRSLIGAGKAVESKGEYDLVVAGGGYAGISTALSAARQGLRVALVQDRGVLGGNGSSEVRVWADGGTLKGRYPHVGAITEEFSDRAPDSPAAAEHFGDEWKERLVRAEPNIELFLHHFVFAASTDPQTKAIRHVTALDCRTGIEKIFTGRFYADCTGHGTLGEVAGAAFQMSETGRMGTTNLWVWQKTAQPQPWPETPWALQMEQGKDFPSTPLSRSVLDGEKFRKGEWYWESGFDKHPISELERIRDWNLRAVFGAFSALHRQPDMATAALQWISPIGGTRESRRLEGDLMVSREDILARKTYPDGCVTTTFGIDLHFPRQQFAKNYPDNPYISRCEVRPLPDRVNGFELPYRCFYSRNVPNLFMAGRNISVTHEGLGTVRVMRNCGMMGEVIGKAAYVALKHHVTPRDVYENYWSELDELLRQPHYMRRASQEASLQADAGIGRIGELEERHHPAIRRVATNRESEHVPIEKLEGLVIDDIAAVVHGYWWTSENVPGYIGDCYLRAWGGSNAEVHYHFRVPKTGRYEVRLSYLPYNNRASNVPVTIQGATEGPQSITLNQKEKPELSHHFHKLGTWTFDSSRNATLSLSAKTANGLVHADCVQLVPVE